MLSRQSARAIVPPIISQLLTKKNTIELGNLSPTRDLTYVKDTCYAFLEIYKSSTLFGQIANIGMNSEISIGDLVNLIAKILGLEGANHKMQSEEHLVLEYEKENNFKIGDVFYAIRFHICTTVAKYSKAYAVIGGEIDSFWKIEAQNY